MGADDRRRGVRCQHAAHRFGVSVPCPRLKAEEVQCTGGLIGGVELEGQAAQDTDLHHSRGVLRPPGFGAKVVGADNGVRKCSPNARAFVEVHLQNVELMGQLGGSGERLEAASALHQQYACCVDAWDEFNRS